MNSRENGCLTSRGSANSFAATHTPPLNADGRQSQAGGISHHQSTFVDTTEKS
jgi:hypothetical protein